MLSSFIKDFFGKKIKRFSPLLIILTLFGCVSTTDMVLYKGIDRQGRGQYDEAIAEYESLLNQGISLTYQAPSDPDNRSIGGLLALAYVMKMDTDSAIKIAEQTLKENPNDFTVLASLGIAQIAKNDFVNAEANLQKAINIRPTMWHAYDWLASIYLIENALDKAKTYLEKSLGVNPRSFISRCYIIIIESIKGNKKNAVKEFEQLLDITKIVDISLISRKKSNANSLSSSLNFILVGDIEKANLQLQEYVEKNPKDGANFLLGFTYLLKGDKTLSIECLQKELESNGPFCYLSSAYVAALYAYDRDVYNFIKILGSMTKRCWY